MIFGMCVQSPRRGDYNCQDLDPTYNMVDPSVAALFISLYHCHISSAPLACQLVIATAPGARNPNAIIGTPLVITGLIMTSAGTIVFPSTLAYLSNQVLCMTQHSAMMLLHRIV